MLVSNPYFSILYIDIDNLIWMPVLAPINCSYYGLVNIDSVDTYLSLNTLDVDQQWGLPGGAQEVVSVAHNRIDCRWKKGAVMFYAKQATVGTSRLLLKALA